MSGRAAGESDAQAAISAVARPGVGFRPDMDSVLWEEAGRIKSQHRRVSLADCFAIALTNRLRAELVSADQHELDPLAAASVVPIRFFR